MSADGVVRTKQVEHVLELVIDRPAKKNALTLAMYEQLGTALATAEEEVSIRAVLLTGADGCFTAGNDLVDFMQNPPDGDDTPVGRFLLALGRARKPVVAAVEGHAVGVGTTMLLHCDLVYAGPDARFALPFASLGLCPEFASSFLLPRMAGLQRASELLLLGERFDAMTAHGIGLVNEVVDGGRVLERARERAAKLAALPPASVRLTKALIRASARAGVEEAMKRESEHFFERLRSPEAAESMSAFLQKRAPDFSRFE